ncbi:MAG: DUF692 family multinuclear iron-containing protein, partial [Planctomycetaceae bacterium]
MFIGVGYRHQLARWIESHPPELNFLELTAEHFFDTGEERLRRLAARYPLSVHGLGLSLGTPGPLDAETLKQFARVVEIAQPKWISEHVAFTRTQEVDLGHLTPVQPNRSTLNRLVEHARQLADHCERPLLLENITSYLRLPGEMDEPEFLNELCEAAGCGLLLDVTNLFVNSRNHRYDPVQWLRQIVPANIVQLHIVGYSFLDGYWQDHHDAPIQDDLWQLLERVLAYAPVQSIIIERDVGFPCENELRRDLRRLKEAMQHHGNDDGNLSRPRESRDQGGA